MPEKKPLFAVEVKARLRVQRMKQLALAEQVGMRVESLRTALHRGRFSLDVALRIARVLNMAKTGDELQEAYDFPSSATGRREGFIAERKHPSLPQNLLSFFPVLDRTTSPIKKAVNSTLEVYANAIASMKEGDFHAVITQSVAPIEMTGGDGGQAIQQTIGKAIQHGGFFLYVRARDKNAENLARMWGFAVVESQQAASSQFAEFKEGVVSYLTGACNRTRTQAEKKFANHVVQLYSPLHPFFFPGFSFGLLRTFDNQGFAQGRVSVRLPGNAGFVVLHDEQLVRRLSRAIKVGIENPARRKLCDVEGEDKAAKRAAFVQLDRAMRLLNDYKPPVSARKSDYSFKDGTGI